MKLTKKLALEICRDLWTWMRDEKRRSSDSKELWPRWESNGGDIEDMLDDCPCCAYLRNLEAITSKLIGCKEGCLLVPYAWIGCTDRGSPYYMFAIGIGSPRDAQKIIDACNAALRDLCD